MMGEKRASVWILGDQLLARHPALAAAGRKYAKAEIRVVLVESLARAMRLPYQRKKLVLLFSAMRHYAADLRRLGYAVDYLRAPSFLEGLREHVAAWQPVLLYTMEASEWRERKWQQARMAGELGLKVTLLPNTQFLTGSYDPFPDIQAPKRVLMGHFYRRMRQRYDVLMTRKGEPVGGRWNYDAENRKALPRGVRPPPAPTFEPDDVTRQVIAEVEESDRGVGTTRGFTLAVTRDAVLRALEDFVERRLPDFGPYEDAMSSEHPTLFHSVLSPYLNIGLLEPMELVAAAEQAYNRSMVPINSAEGFVRQVLGWREYVHWQYWRLMPGLAEANAWAARRPLPGFFWGEGTEMRCLSLAIARAIETGYNHHIERLMLLCNFCLLAGIEPRRVNDWFLSCYVDAYEWVMVPNVMGMGLNADGGLIASKPYIASANYINRMSDYCQACRYDHTQRSGEYACPFNFLYWNFLLENEDRLRGNPRLGRSVLGLRHLDAQERAAVRRRARGFLQGLE